MGISQEIRVKFVYEGHPVKVKVTGAKKSCLCDVTFECLDLHFRFAGTSWEYLGRVYISV